jgi:hypothetical protein
VREALGRAEASLAEQTAARAALQVQLDNVTAAYESSESEAAKTIKAQAATIAELRARTYTAQDSKRKECFRV